MVELLQSGEKSGESRQAASSLNALLTGGARKKASVRCLLHAQFRWPACCTSSATGLLDARAAPLVCLLHKEPDCPMADPRTVLLSLGQQCR